MRKNKNDQTDLPLTISSKDGLVDQVTFFNKTVASKDMSGYYLLQKGEYAYNKSYSVGYDFGSIKRLERYPMGALSTLYICFALTKYNSDYIKTYFDSLKWYKEIYMISAEGARNHGLLNVPTDDFFSTYHYITENTNEQEKIAKLMELIESRIQKQQALVDNLKKYKRGLNIRLIADIPKNCNTTLGSVCSIVGGGTPDTTENRYWNGDIYWFTPSEVGNTKYVSTSERCISSYGLSKSSAKLLPVNTILLTTRATLGEMSILQKEATTNQGFQSLIASNNIIPEYIYYLQVIIKPWCEKYSSGNTFREISKTSLSKCIIPVPDISVQNKIVSTLSKIDEHILTEDIMLKNLLLLKKSLLQQLFI